MRRYLFLSRMKDIIFKLSGVLILASAIVYLIEPVVASWVMIVGVLLFSFSIVSAPYKGENIRMKRLYGFRVLSCGFMIASAYLMYEQNSLWPLVMIVGAVFMMYSAFAMPGE
jgi:hypothetical protein